MAGHDIDAEQFACIDHVLCVGPQRGGRTLPGVTAVQQQRAGARSTGFIDQRLEVGKAADFAVGACSGLEVEVGKCMRFTGTRTNAVMF
jgi:hypothetical protein